MFKTFRNKIKNFLGADDVFSSMSILPFSKYKKNYSPSDYLNAYEISLYANRSINKRAEKVGEIEFQLFKGDTEIESDQILDLLENPNKNSTGSQFWALYQKYYDIFGEVYIKKDTELRLGGVTRVNAMHLLKSDMVKPKFSKETGELISVELNTPEGTTTYQGDEILYIRNPRPSNPLRGESLISSGIRQLETSTQIDEYHSKILENGGRVESVITFDSENLNKQQLTDIKESYQEQYGAASKAGLPMFLSGKAKFDRLGLDPAELAYLETKKVNFNDITVLTGVPKALLGLTSDETFANADSSIRIFLKEYIKPLLKVLTDSLNRDLAGDGFELRFVDPTPEIKEEKRKDAENGIKNYYLTPNEAREMFGLSPLKGGDDLLAPLNIIPLGKEKEVKESKSKAVITKIAHPLQDEENRKIYHTLSLKRLDRRQKKVEEVVVSYFNGQMERIIAPLREEKSFKKKGLIDEIFVQSLEIKLAKDTLLPVLQELLQEAAEDSKEMAGSDWEFNFASEISGWLDKKVSIFAEQINSTTFEKLSSEFTISSSLGEDREALINRIQETYGSINESRAATIARTEVHGVTQYGTIQGYKQAGLPIKIWVWAPGTQGGVRDAHKAMDGEEVPIDTAFSNGLMFPGDYTGGAGETINCQCFI